MKSPLLCAFALGFSVAAYVACAGTYSGVPGTIDTSGVTPAPVVSFQQTAATSAAALQGNTFTNGVVCTAKTSNTGTIYVGGSGVTTAAGYPLSAGQSISYGVGNSNQISIIGTNTTDVLACTGN